MYTLINLIHRENRKDGEVKGTVDSFFYAPRPADFGDSLVVYRAMLLFANDSRIHCHIFPVAHPSSSVDYVSTHCTDICSFKLIECHLLGGIGTAGGSFD